MDKDKSPDFPTGYFDRAVRDLPGIIRQAKRELRELEFDVIIGTGFSGSVVIPALAMALKKPWCLVRKESDDSHHGGGRLVGNLGERWLFVDDFVSSGHTLKRVWQKVNQAAALHDRDIEFVGAWLYTYDWRDGFRPPQDFDYVFDPERLP